MDGESVPNKGRTSDAWQEYDGLIVDITSDQFGRLPVLLTRNRYWHNEFDDVDRQTLPTDECWWDSNCAPVFRAPH